MAGMGPAVPPIAWLTPETLDRSLEVAIDNLRRLRNGHELLHRMVVSGGALGIEISIN